MLEVKSKISKRTTKIYHITSLYINNYFRHIYINFFHFYSVTFYSHPGTSKSNRRNIPVEALFTNFTFPHFVLNDCQNMPKSHISHKTFCKQEYKQGSTRHSGYMHFLPEGTNATAYCAGKTSLSQPSGRESSIARLELCRMLTRSFSSGINTALPRRASTAMDQHITSFDARNSEYLTSSDGMDRIANGILWSLLILLKNENM